MEYHNFMTNLTMLHVILAKLDIDFRFFPPSNFVDLSHNMNLWSNNPCARVAIWDFVESNKIVKI